MRIKNIIPGQSVTNEKQERARELRRKMTPAEKLLWHELRGNKLESTFLKSFSSLAFHPKVKDKNGGQHDAYGFYNLKHLFQRIYLDMQGYRLFALSTTTIYG